MSQGQVGVDRIEALILEPIGLDFLQQTDPAPFLRQVDEHPAPSLEIISMARWSWSPQSQRSEASTSPVKQEECSRTNGARGSGNFAGSPNTIASGSCVSYLTP